MHVAATLPQIRAYGAIHEDPSDTFTGIGERRFDPMVGSCDETVVRVHGRNSTSVCKILQGSTPPIAGGVTEASMRQCYSYGKRYSCDHVGCGLHFERRSEFLTTKKHIAVLTVVTSVVRRLHIPRTAGAMRRLASGSITQVHHWA